MIPVYTPPTKAVRLAEGVDLIVRGLSLEDITVVLRDHLPDVVRAVDQYGASKQDVYTRSNMDAFLANVLVQVPSLAAVMIAQAAGEPDAAEAVRSYPAGAQVRALFAIAELSITDMGELADPSPALASLVRRILGASGLRTNGLPDSTGRSDAPSLNS